MQCDINCKIINWNFNTRVHKTLRCSMMLQLKMHQFLDEDLHLLPTDLGGNNRTKEGK